MSNFGLLPPEYNVRVHGPYFPGYDYRKPDTKFADVKLGEVSNWLSRRSYNPFDIMRAIHRPIFRFYFRRAYLKHFTISTGIQMMFFLNLVFLPPYLIDNLPLKQARYH